METERGDLQPVVQQHAGSESDWVKEAGSGERVNHFIDQIKSFHIIIQKKQSKAKQSKAKQASVC